MNVEIVPANVDDAERVLAYYTDLLAERIPFIMDNPVPTLEQEIEFIQKHDGQGDVLLLAVCEEQIVGSSGYHIAVHHQRAHTCSLGISVAKAWRRRGIGAKLIRAGEKWCSSRSIRRLCFEVVDGNPAVGFYQGLGFEIEGRKRKAIRVGDTFR